MLPLLQPAESRKGHNVLPANQEQGFARHLEARIEQLEGLNAQRTGDDMQIVNGRILLTPQDAGDEVG